MRPTLRAAFLGFFLVPLTSPALAQRVTCFEDAPPPPWEASTVGVVPVAASRAVAKAFELCSVSRGFEPAVDQLYFLYRPVRAEFEALARLDELSGPGLGGVMARLDVRTGNYPYLQISAARSPTGALVLSSSYRLNAGEPAGAGGVRSIPIELPVWLRIRREADQMTTSFSSDGRDFHDHLRGRIAATQLESFFLSAGLVQASQSDLPGTAVFTSPSVKTTETEFPPVLLSVQPPNSPLEGGVQVTIRGRGLSSGDGIRAVSLAGIPAEVLRVTDDLIVVQAGPAPGEVAGDVVVVGYGGEESIENAFVYLGHTFIRGDVNGDGADDISDVLSGLNFLFKNGRPPACLEAADSNADGDMDVSDSVYLILHFFLARFPLPQPFPEPGLSPDPRAPCGVPVGPRILDVSPRDLAPGDEVTIAGEGFSRIPEENLVYLGDSPVQILQASPTVLRGRMGDVARTGTVQAASFANFGIVNPGACKTKSCFSAPVGLVSSASEVLVNLTSANTDVLGSAKPDAANPGALVLNFDVGRWNPEETYGVRGRLNVPPLTGLSRGNLLLDFEYQHAAPGIRFDEWLQGLADALNQKLNGRGDSQEIVVSRSRDSITLELRPEIADRAGPDWQDSTTDVIEGQVPLSPCGLFSPDTDTRGLGWCLFGELIKECNGLPTWEYFIPKQLVFQASGSIFPLPHPNTLSPAQKDVLYNRDAYCHVRTNGLYKACVLDSLVAIVSQPPYPTIARFPWTAVLVKTRWASEAQMINDGKDLSKHYSYVNAGTRWYLTLLHFMDKTFADKTALAYWFFADFYVPEPAGYGGCGASGADRPASITGVWANYAMCTNLDSHEPDDACGNAVIDGECNRNCRWCHRNSSWTIVDENERERTVYLDSVFSIGFGAISGPPACP